MPSLLETVLDDASKLAAEIQSDVMADEIEIASAIAAALRRAVLREREACAKEAEQWRTGPIAAENIRARM